MVFVENDNDNYKKVRFLKMKKLLLIKLIGVVVI